MLGVEGDGFDANYNNMCGEAVLELIDIFRNQGHSGMSRSIVLEMFQKVADFKALSPLTNRPDEWMEVGEGMWRNRRQSDAFSTDGGHTYYLLDDKVRHGWKRQLFGLGRKYYETEKVEA